MKYLVVAKWDESFNPSSINHRNTVAEAQALVAKLINDMPAGEECPDAFYVENPGGSTAHITVDPTTKTISLDTPKRLMDEWEAVMALTDLSMTRTDEDIIDVLSQAQRDVLDRKTLKGAGSRYDAKKALRLRRP